MKIHVLIFATMLFSGDLLSQNIKNNPMSNHGNRFEQLGTILPAPNEYRTASGAPGEDYWQQRADYDITCSLDDKKLTLFGEETITYYNNSPHKLSYIWLQLDENEHHPDSDNNYFDGSQINAQMSMRDIKDLEHPSKRLKGHGVVIASVLDGWDNPLSYTINQTMMRVDLPYVLNPGDRYSFKVKWSYKIPDRMTVGGRGGYEFFSDHGNYIFTITQWYPRVCVYSDFEGWQNKQFTGRGEFALNFGNFYVRMTVPKGYVVASTGECMNMSRVLSRTEMDRWMRAQSSQEPVEIVTLDEAKKAEKETEVGTQTWEFRAENVRDFAWCASKKFVWDAMPVIVNGRKVMCMSFYGKEAYGLYKPYSTKVVAHSLKVYSEFTIPYPYPVAQSVEASNGMEYPMICFNYGRTADDGTYTEGTKNGMISVIIHEIGHNFFPMIVNSDERQWTWMDEGLNTFVQYLAEQRFDIEYPSRRGPPSKITGYMGLSKDQLEPIMTNSENIIHFGYNAYAKPAAGLNILRETVMGRDLFDYAFKEYSRRWAFKHPTPADFFRTMEDASGVDLDWFWRGWFYDTDPVDISLDSVMWYKVNYKEDVLPMKDTLKLTSPKPVFDKTYLRNKADKSLKPLVEIDKSLQDFYYQYKPWKTKDSIFTLVIERYTDKIDLREKERLTKKKNYYELYFSNKGGLVMPIIILWKFKDGTKEIDRIPVEIWRKNEQNVSKVFVKEKAVQEIILDPYKETADIDYSNNMWPVKVLPSRFKIFREKKSSRGQSIGDNIMNRVQKERGGK